MPITQDRMLAVLNAAEDYAQAYDALCKMIHDQFQRVASGEVHWQEAAEYLEMTATHNMLMIRQTTTIATLATERSHFRHSTIKRNDRLKLKQEQKREAKGCGTYRKQYDRQSSTAPYNPLPERLVVRSAEAIASRQAIQNDPDLIAANAANDEAMRVEAQRLALDAEESAEAANLPPGATDDAVDL